MSISGRRGGCVSTSPSQESRSVLKSFDVQKVPQKILEKYYYTRRRGGYVPTSPSWEFNQGANLKVFDVQKVPQKIQKKYYYTLSGWMCVNLSIPRIQSKSKLKGFWWTKVPKDTKEICYTLSGWLCVNLSIPRIQSVAYFINTFGVLFECTNSINTYFPSQFKSNHIVGLQIRTSMIFVYSDKFSLTNEIFGNSIWNFRHRLRHLRQI